jgi:hypothetical protein
VVGWDGMTRYVEHMPKIAQHPNYEAVLAAVCQIVG